MTLFLKKRFEPFLYQNLQLIRMPVIRPGSIEFTNIPGFEGRRMMSVKIWSIFSFFSFKIFSAGIGGCKALARHLADRNRLFEVDGNDLLN